MSLAWPGYVIFSFVDYSHIILFSQFQYIVSFYFVLSCEDDLGLVTQYYLVWPCF
uniref:Uncharacterized protein n=1 Tax=Oryza brachyantha TaxID=4533 RepID=J3MGS9_ORYBR